MTKLTDRQLAELTATKVMGWKKDKTLSGRPCYRNDSERGSVMADQWNPCNDWNDAMMAANTLSGEDKLALSDMLEDFFARTFLDNLTPRKLTEFTLKAAGVDVE